MTRGAVPAGVEAAAAVVRMARVTGTATAAEEDEFED